MYNFLRRRQDEFAPFHTSYFELTMEFITVLDPSQKSSAASSRRAHSHAARVAHARARKIRVEEHMRQKHMIKQKELTHAKALVDEIQEDSILISREQRLSQLKTTPSIPLLLPTAFEHEPLAGFLRSLTTRERFMFNHC